MNRNLPTSDRLARRIFIGLACGILLGIAGRSLAAWVPTCQPLVRWVTREVLDPAGQVFLRLLFFVVVPLVFCSLAQGIAQLKQLGRLGPLAMRTFTFFAINMIIGVVLGIALMNLVDPGSRIDPGARQELLAEYGSDAQALQAKAAAQQGISFRRLVEMFLPRNLLQAVVDFQLLPLILFAILTGAAATFLPEDRRSRVESALQLGTQLMTGIVHFAMTLAPYAVAALVASVILLAGVQILRPLAWFVGAVLAAMSLHLLGSMPLLLKTFSRHSPASFLANTRAVLLTAFSTSSSSATLPAAIEVSRQRLGISPTVSGFVLPLGATLNMSGTALYEGCVVLFVAQVYGVSLPLIQQVQLVLLAVLSAVAVAGVPGASLPLLVGLLANYGLPPEGIALILGFDRLLDMARTTLNVAGDLVTACIVEHQSRFDSAPAGGDGFESG